MKTEDIVRAVAEAQPADLPELVAAFAQAQAVALARLTTRPSDQAAPVEDRLLTMKEVAERLGVKECRAREMGRRGELPVVTVGERFVRVRASALGEWMFHREVGRSIGKVGKR